VSYNGPVRQALLLGVVIAAAVCVPVALGDNVWSGTWSPTSTGSTLNFHWVSDSAGRSALQDAGGDPCDDPTDYFDGTYFNQPSGDSGSIVGCTTKKGCTLEGRYVGKQAAGSFTISWRDRNPPRFTGSYDPDDGEGNGWSGTFSKHFSGDGQNRGTLCGQGAAGGGGGGGSGGRHGGGFIGPLEFTADMYAHNVKVLPPLVGDFQLGVVRIKGSGKIDADGSASGSFHVTFDPERSRYSPTSLSVSVVDAGVTKKGSKTTILLKVKITGSNNPRGQCPVGDTGLVTLIDWPKKLSNGKDSDFISITDWTKACGHQHGTGNEDSAKALPTRGGPPDGGQWAIVKIHRLAGGGGGSGQGPQTANAALGIVVGIIKHNAQACRLTRYEASATGHPGSWKVTVKLTFADGHTDTATWNLVGDKVAPADQLAAEVSDGCP
jgi:hypothetical protein